MNLFKHWKKDLPASLVVFFVALPLCLGVALASGAPPFAINFNKIIDIEDNSVLIEKSVVPISRSNRPELMRRLNLL